MQLISEHPYVPVYRVLLAKKYQPENGDAYRHALHQAALHSPDRIRLYELLHIPEVAETVDTIVADKPKDQKLPVEKEPFVQEVQPKVEESASTDEPVIPEAAPIEVEVEYIEDDTGLKNTLMKSAAERHISMDEKHTFLEWLDILENPVAEPEHSSDETLDKQFKEHQAASSYEADLHRETKELEAEVAEDDIVGLKKVGKLAKKSIRAGAGLATETLAQIMLKQGKIKEAIAVYEQLRLKYPEKSDYFAALISDLKAR